jgi:hypothetical protein
MSMPEPTLALLECFLGFGRAIGDNDTSRRVVVSIVLQELPGNDYHLFTLRSTSPANRGCRARDASTSRAIRPRCWHSLKKRTKVKSAGVDSATTAKSAKYVSGRGEEDARAAGLAPDTLVADASLRQVVGHRGTLASFHCGLYPDISLWPGQKRSSHGRSAPACPLRASMSRSFRSNRPRRRGAHEQHLLHRRGRSRRRGCPRILRASLGTGTAESIGRSSG